MFSASFRLRVVTLFWELLTGSFRLGAVGWFWEFLGGSSSPLQVRGGIESVLKGEQRRLHGVRVTESPQGKFPVYV